VRLVRRLLVLLAAALALAPAAAASPAVRYGIEDDAWLQFGPGTLASRLAELDRLGVRLVRFNVHWNLVAPTRPTAPRSSDDPAYRFGGVDAVLQGLHEDGISVVLGLVGTPRWANGGRSSNWAPTHGADFASFAYAVARRYPWVRQFLVWNEPNQRIWLRPTSPAVYVTKLLNPAYAAIHAATPGAQVGGGVTAPRASYLGVSPVAFIAGMKAAGAKLDAYAHHPYPSSPKTETPFAGGCDHCTTITMATLPRLLASVTSAFGPKPIWLSEYGYQTDPPDPYLGVSPALQAIYIGEAALRAYLAPRVTMLIQYLYRDEPGLDRFQSGLVYRDGAAKPARAAFALPLAQLSRTGPATRLWGQVRPGQERRVYQLQQLRDDHWYAVGDPARTDASGTFRRTVRAPKGSLVRIWAPQAKLVSPPLRVT
jgi:hypothetical protein